MILPPATLGILGGGQLGRYFVRAAQQMGYRTMLLDPDPNVPAMADEHLCTSFDNTEALDFMAQHCEGITLEFENVPYTTLAYLAERVKVTPSPEAVRILQDRWLEKNFLLDKGFPHAPFVPINTDDDLQLVPGMLFPAILKRVRMGYDGKGQARVAHGMAARSVWKELGSQPCILEKELPLTGEFSIILARNKNGHMATYPLAWNTHKQGVLDYTCVSRTPPLFIERAKEIACTIAEQLQYEGVMGVEFFIGGEHIWVNEIAPRPHNSGHYTLDACSTSQFMQQVRTLCGLPLANTAAHKDAVMINLMGDLWENGEPFWEQILLQPDIHLHLYGKIEARPGRKMGHFTVLADKMEDAWTLAASCRKKFGQWEP